MLITSVDNDRIKNICKLKDKKYRDETKTFLIESGHLVLEAAKAGLIKELILEKDELFPIDIRPLYVTREIIKKISDLDNPSNVMAIVSKKEEEPIGEKILILDGVQDPGNLGTIIRSCVAFNIDTLVLSPNTVDLYNPKVIRSTQGMMFHLNVIVRDVIPFINELKQDYYKIIGTRVTYGTNIKDAKIFSHFALVVGNEGKGIREEVLELCDENLYINMNEKCESLNVGVASSILLYEINNK